MFWTIMFYAGSKESLLEATSVIVCLDGLNGFYKEAFTFSTKEIGTSATWAIFSTFKSVWVSKFFTTESFSSALPSILAVSITLLASRLFSISW